MQHAVASEQSIVQNNTDEMSSLLSYLMQVMRTTQNSLHAAEFVMPVAQWLVRSFSLDHRVYIGAVDFSLVGTLERTKVKVSLRQADRDMVRGQS